MTKLDALQREYGTEQAKQQFKTALACSMLMQADSRVQFVFNLMLAEKNMHMTFLLGNPFLIHIEPKRKQNLEHSIFVIFRPSPAQVLIFFHFLAFMHCRQRQ